MSETADRDGFPGFARRGAALYASGDVGGALRVLTAGLAHFPDGGGVIARVVLARISRDAGREIEEREWLESALRIDPECPAALFRLSELSARVGGRDPHRERLAAQEPWDDEFRDSGPIPVAPSPKRRVPQSVPAPTSAFAFPVREEEEEPENDENSAPHVATVTLAEIYFQQGLKEQAAQIYRQMLERQPGDDAVRRRLAEIEVSIAEPG